MKITVHASRLEDDMHFVLGAPFAPSSLEPVAERQWVRDDSEDGGHSKLTGRNLTDGQGNALFSVPVTTYGLDGHEVRGVRMQVRGLSSSLPGLKYLRPTGEVSVTFSSFGNGTMTIVADDLEPIPAVDLPVDGEAL